MAISEFLDNLIDQIAPAHLLRISIEETTLFDLTEVTTYAEGLDWLEDVPLGNKYDFILGEFPFNGRTEFHDFGETLGRLRIDRSWLKILKACEFLSEDGYGLFVLPPMDFTERTGMNFNTILNSAGINIWAIINTPRKEIPREIRFSPTLIIVRKNPIESIFLVELEEDEEAENVALSLLSRNDTNDNLLEGILAPLDSFQSFNNIRLNKLIQNVKTEYKGYQDFTINDLVSDTNQVQRRNAHIEYDNAIYVPLVFHNNRIISKNPPSDNINVHHNLLQLILNDKVINEYLELFFKSHLGILIYQSMYNESGRNMPTRTTYRRIRETKIPLPSLEKQKEIVYNYKRLEIVKEGVKKLEDTLSLDPTIALLELKKINDIITILDSTN